MFMFRQFSCLDNFQKQISNLNCTKKILMNGITMMGVVSHPQPDILECEVKWALLSNAVNKVSACDTILVELFKTLKDDAIKVLHI